MSQPTRHEESDRALFDSLATQYVEKDTARAPRIAREQRLRRSLRAAGVEHACVLLEVGCGSGFSAEYLSGRFDEYYGVDYATNMIEFAKKRHGRPGVQFFSSNVNDFEPPKPLDAILMIGVLHHLDDIPRTLSHLCRMLKPGGVLIANEPHPGNPLVSFLRAIRKRVDANYSADQRELRASELDMLLRQAGLEHVRTVPQGVLGTPFAEVLLGPQWLFAPLARAACAADAAIERLPRSVVLRLSWNVVAIGRRPV